MSNKETGGPAFPFWSDTQHLAGYEGMSLRDYFAAQAMQGICARVNWDEPFVAERAYKMADAMLKARDNGNS